MPTVQCAAACKDEILPAPGLQQISVSLATSRVIKIRSFGKKCVCLKLKDFEDGNTSI